MLIIIDKKRIINTSINVTKKDWIKPIFFDFFRRIYYFFAKNPEVQDNKPETIPAIAATMAVGVE